MSADDVRVDPDGDAPQLVELADDPQPAAPPPARGPGSFLEALQAEQHQLVEDEYKVLPIGKSAHLFARYRSLEDEEEADLEEVWVPFAELVDAVLSGDVADGPVVQAVLAWHVLRERAR